jgi:tRNA (guanosine-2'-O-)-methyltransferase
VPLFQLSVGPDACIAIGNEDHGLAAGTLAACDAVAFIPQLGRVGSLNVATAAAIALFEVRRRDWAGSW